MGQQLLTILILGLSRTALCLLSINEIGHLHLPAEHEFHFMMMVTALQLSKFFHYTSNKIDYSSEEALNRLDHITLFAVGVVCLSNLSIDLILHQELVTRIEDVRNTITFLAVFVGIETLFKALLKLATEDPSDSVKASILQFFTFFKQSFVKFFTPATSRDKPPVPPSNRQAQKEGFQIRNSGNRNKRKKHRSR